MLEKVFAIAGDCVEPDLGLSETDKKSLLTEVNCVFHCAATVRFDEKIRTAVNINVRATRDLLAMAREMKQLTVGQLLYLYADLNKSDKLGKVFFLVFRPLFYHKFVVGDSVRIDCIFKLPHQGDRRNLLQFSHFRRQPNDCGQHFGRGDSRKDHTHVSLKKKK